MGKFHHSLGLTTAYIRIRRAGQLLITPNNLILGVTQTAVALPNAFGTVTVKDGETKFGLAAAGTSLKYICLTTKFVPDTSPVRSLAKAATKAARAVLKQLDGWQRHWRSFSQRLPQGSGISSKALVVPKAASLSQAASLIALLKTAAPTPQAAYNTVRNLVAVVREFLAKHQFTKGVVRSEISKDGVSKLARIEPLQSIAGPSFLSTVDYIDEYETKVAIYKVHSLLDAKLQQLQAKVVVASKTEATAGLSYTAKDCYLDDAANKVCHEIEIQDPSPDCGAFLIRGEGSPSACLRTWAEMFAIYRPSCQDGKRRNLVATTQQFEGFLHCEKDGGVAEPITINPGNGEFPLGCTLRNSVGRSTSISGKPLEPADFQDLLITSRTRQAAREEAQMWRVSSQIIIWGLAAIALIFILMMIGCSLVFLCFRCKQRRAARCPPEEPAAGKIMEMQPLTAPSAPPSYIITRASPRN